MPSGQPDVVSLLEDPENYNDTLQTTDEFRELERKKSISNYFPISKKEKRGGPLIIHLNSEN